MIPDLSFELGMPHLGRNNLSESALFKSVGHDRWKQIQELGGLPTSEIRDDAGSRLYPTFFFLELHLSPQEPLSVYGENDAVNFKADLSHYEKVYLDGLHIVAGRPDRWIRSSNVFIFQERGPSKLSMSVPSAMDFASIPKLETPPSSLDLCRQARINGAFWDPEPEDLPLFEGKKEYVYRIDSDRDLNGAGLIYFANFLSFMDLAEREVLSSLPDPVPVDLLDSRSPYRRRVGYYGNAQCTDRLHIFVAARMRIVPGSEEGAQLLDMGIDHEIRRSSDNKLVLISSCRKVSSLERNLDAKQWAIERFSPPVGELMFTGAVDGK